VEPNSTLDVLADLFGGWFENFFAPSAFLGLHCSDIGSLFCEQPPLFADGSSLVRCISEHQPLVFDYEHQAGTKPSVHECALA